MLLTLMVVTASIVDARETAWTAAKRQFDVALKVAGILEKDLGE